MSMRLSTAEAVVAATELPVWLCIIRLPDGRALRFASRPILVETQWANQDEPWDWLPFLSGVDEFEQEIDVFSLDGVGALTQARIEIATPGTDLLELQDDWYHLTAATIELSILWEGQYFEDRLVVLAGGTVAGFELGEEGEPSGFSIEATPPSSSASVGDDGRDMGDDWPPPLVDNTAADMSDVTGSKGISVYGDPNSIPAYKVGDVGGNNRLVLANHFLARTGASYTVTVYEDGASAGAHQITNDTVNGNPYAYVEHATFFAAADGAYTWQASYGGIPAADGADRPALNAEGVARRLLVDSGLPVDWRRTELCLAKLRDWKMGFYIDQEALAIELLRERILAYLPVVELNSGDGIWLHYCDPHEAPIEATLTVGQELIGRVGRMESSDLETIRNSFTINFDYDAFNEVYRQTLTLDETNSTICYLSKQLLTRVDERGQIVDTGVREDEPIDCDSTSDPPTALRILTARANRLALPRRILTYEVAPDAYWLEAGMVVSLTDAARSIAAHRGVITALNRSLYPFHARIELIDLTPFARATP